MKAILLMFDSLNRHMLSPYGCDFFDTPNFRRLAARSVTFDRAYVASMPCMPARRELHTGRYNFLHREWGGFEVYDDSCPALLSKAGISTHVCTDHYHYWEDGGSHYLERFDTYQMFRGQENDAWIPRVENPDMSHVHPSRREQVQNEKNRTRALREEDWPIHQTMSAGIEFLDHNHQADNWFLQIETFDPHEPFFAPERLREKHASGWDGPRVDWPAYGRVAALGYTEPEVRQMRAEYLASLAFCDEQLGRVLDTMDRLNLWDDTMLIVNTDHGFLLGEKGLLAKCVIPFYEEVAHIPLFVWDPRSRKAGERCDQFVQTIDLPATLLEYFGVDRTPDMMGRPLRDAIATGKPAREGGLFGMHGNTLGIIDAKGRVLYLPPLPDTQFFNYTLDFSHMRSLVGIDWMQQAEWVGPLPFTKNVGVLRLPARGWTSQEGYQPGIELYDLNADPHQDRPFRDPGIEAELHALAVRLMAEASAPTEMYARYGLPSPA